MKRFIALLTLLVGLALAQVPAYPENTIGLGFGIGNALGSSLILQGSTSLPFSPLGLDTGLDAEVIVPTSFSGVEVWSLVKVNLLPALTVLDLSLSAGLGLDLSYSTATGFGTHLGPVASLEIPGGAISAYIGLGYENGFNVAYGLGGRLYLDPIALEVATSDRYALKLALLYLW